MQTFFLSCHRLTRSETRHAVDLLGYSTLRLILVRRPSSLNPQTRPQQFKALQSLLLNHKSSYNHRFPHSALPFSRKSLFSKDCQGSRHEYHTTAFNAASMQTPSKFQVKGGHAEMMDKQSIRDVEVLADHLEAPSLDDRSYRVIRLSNKLEALLVHDPETDQASAAMDVNVGNYSDPEDMPGMAHAVEHLLFMGTEKACFPSVDLGQC